MQHLLFGDGQDDDTQSVVLSYGMGVDSTALLLRWLKEPKSRDFSLDSLVVLSAQTGDEFRDTQRLVETHILPLLRQFRLRYVQIARHGPLQEDGITVLEDSRAPTRLFIEGDYKLSQELQANGTVPQMASGKRRCSHKFKAFPLTEWTDREFGDQEVRKVLGFNADELYRVERSDNYATSTRPIEYPLFTWGWGRRQCEEYVQGIVGEPWQKSCCSECPFPTGKPDILARYRQFPADAAQALYLEFLSLCFNPLSPLYGRKTLRSILEADGNAEALRLLEERLDAETWAVYRVRRIVWAKGRADRKTERLCEGTRTRMTSNLLKQGAERDGHYVRLSVREREGTFPTLEELLVAAPGVVQQKSRPKFEENWTRISSGSLFDAP